MFLEISQNSQENTCARVSFLAKKSNFIKKETLAQVLSCEFCEISKNTFFTEHLWWLLLKESPQDEFISGVFFKIAFENALRDLRSELKNNPNIEHSYSKVSFLPTEMIYANDSDFPSQSQVKSNEIKTKTNNILSRHSLKVSDEKWSISLDQYSKVLYSLFLLYAKLRAIKIY